VIAGPFLRSQLRRNLVRARVRAAYRISGSKCTETLASTGFYACRRNRMRRASRRIPATSHGGGRWFETSSAHSGTPATPHGGGRSSFPPAAVTSGVTPSAGRSRIARTTRHRSGQTVRMGCSSRTPASGSVRDEPDLLGGRAAGLGERDERGAERRTRHPRVERQPATARAPADHYVNTSTLGRLHERQPEARDAGRGAGGPPRSPVAPHEPPGDGARPPPGACNRNTARSAPPRSARPSTGARGRSSWQEAMR
jgi:hypothetical protein